jgi:hypothetical protein
MRWPAVDPPRHGGSCSGSGKAPRRRSFTWRGPRRHHGTPRRGTGRRHARPRCPDTAGARERPSPGGPGRRERGRAGERRSQRAPGFRRALPEHAAGGPDARRRSSRRDRPHASVLWIALACGNGSEVQRRGRAPRVARLSRSVRPYSGARVARYGDHRPVGVDPPVARHERESRGPTRNGAPGAPFSLVSPGTDHLPRRP